MLKTGSVIQTVNIDNAKRENKRLDLIIDNDLYATVASNNLNVAISPEVEITTDLKAPILKDAIIGKVYYNVDGITYSANLIAKNSVEKSSVLINFIFIFFITVIIIGLLKFKKNFNKKKRLKKLKSRI